MGRVGLFFQPEKVRIAVFIILFAISFVYYEFLELIIFYGLFRLSPYPIYHGFPLSFWTFWRPGFDPAPLPSPIFSPINLAIDLVFWYLVSCPIAFYSTRNKEAVKQFLRPDKKKIAVFILLFTFGIIYHEVWYTLWGRHIDVYGTEIYHGFPFSFFTTWVSPGRGVFPASPIMIERVLPTLAIDLVFWYLVSCLIILAYNNILKPLYTKKPRNDGSEISVQKNRLKSCFASVSMTGFLLEHMF